MDSITSACAWEFENSVAFVMEHWDDIIDDDIDDSEVIEDCPIKRVRVSRGPRPPVGARPDYMLSSVWGQMLRKGSDKMLQDPNCKEAKLFRNIERIHFSGAPNDMIFIISLRNYVIIAICIVLIGNLKIS